MKPIKIYLMALPNDLFLNKHEDLALALQNDMQRGLVTGIEQTTQQVLIG